MPRLRAGASNTPLWSLILAKTGGLSWLGEVNRLVCVTVSQVVTICLDGGHVYSSATPGAAEHCLNTQPPRVGLRGGWGRRGVKKSLKKTYGTQTQHRW